MSRSRVQAEPGEGIMNPLPKLTPSAKQTELGINRVIEKLDKPPYKVILMGEPGTGKTLMTVEVVETVKRFKNGNIALFMQNKFIGEWTRTFARQEQLAAEDQEINWNSSDYLSDKGRFFIVNTENKDIWGDKMREFLLHMPYFRTKPVIFIFDLNYVFYSPNDSLVQLRNKENMVLKTETHFQYYFLSYFCIMQKCSLCIFDEIDWMRSKKDENSSFRKIIKNVLSNAFEDVPLLLVTATPFAGQIKDAELVADFLDIDTEKDEWNMKMKEIIVEVKKHEMSDEEYPSLAPYLVNVNESGTFLESNVKKVIDLCLAWRLENDINYKRKIDRIEHQHEKNIDIYFYNANRYYAAVYCAIQCMNTWKNTNGNHISLLVSVEYIVCGHILRNILNLIYGKKTMEDIIDVYGEKSGHEIMTCFTKKANNVYTFNFKGYNPPEGIEIPFNTTVQEQSEVMETLPPPTDKEAQRYIYDFCQGSGGAKYAFLFQGVKYGCKGWSAVMKRPQDTILHIILQGAPFKHDDFVQLLSRTNRKNSPRDIPAVVLVFGLPYVVDIERNLWKPLKKQYRVRLNITGKEEKDISEFSKAYPELSYDEYSQDNSSKARWIVDHFPTMDAETMNKLIFPTRGDKTWVEGSGFLPLKEFAVNMTESVVVVDDASKSTPSHDDDVKDDKKDDGGSDKNDDEPHKKRAGDDPKTDTREKKQRKQTNKQEATMDVIDKEKEEVMVVSDTEEPFSTIPTVHKMESKIPANIWEEVRTLMKNAENVSLFEPIWPKCDTVHKELMALQKKYPKQDLSLIPGTRQDAVSALGEESRFLSDYHLNYIISQFAKKTTESILLLTDGNKYCMDSYQFQRLYELMRKKSDSVSIPPQKGRRPKATTCRELISHYFDSLFSIDEHWETLCLPVNLNNLHWVTLEIDNTTVKQIRVRDSMRENSFPFAGDEISTKVVNEFISVLNEIEQRKPKNASHRTVLTWTIQEKTVTPNQGSSNDCAIHTAFHCLSIANYFFSSDTNNNKRICKYVRQWLTWKHGLKWLNPPVAP